MQLRIRQRTLFRAALWFSGLLKPATQTSAAERACLALHASRKQRLAEIGVFNVVTTLEIRRKRAANGILWAVDPFARSRLGCNSLASKSLMRLILSQFQRRCIKQL